MVECMWWGMVYNLVGFGGYVNLQIRLNSISLNSIRNFTISGLPQILRKSVNFVFNQEKSKKIASSKNQGNSGKFKLFLFTVQSIYVFYTQSS